MRVGVGIEAVPTMAVRVRPTPALIATVPTVEAPTIATAVQDDPVSGVTTGILPTPATAVTGK